MSAGAGGKSAWAGASGRRAMRDVGRGGAGADNSEGWSEESGSSDARSEAESEEGKEAHTKLIASPWGMQESGECGLWMGVRAGGSGGRKGTSRTADGGETRSRHGAQKKNSGKKGGRRGWENADSGN